MGCLSSKTATSAPHKKKTMLLQARYALPLWILVKKLAGRSGYLHILDTAFANGMTDEKVAEFKDGFKKFDKAGKDAIDSKDVGPLMKATKHIQNDKEIQDIMMQAGVEENDTVDFDLFLKMVLGYTRRADPEVEMKEAFAVFDTNKDGVINSEEMRNVFSNLGARLTDVEVAELIREADLDGDGLVDYNEFIRLLCDPGQEKF